jgi:general secretion pathway protein D
MHADNPAAGRSTHPAWRSVHSRSGWMRGGLAVLAVAILALLGMCRVSYAQDPAKKPEGEEPEKKYEFRMEGKPWKAVFELLTSLTEKPVMGPYVPTGSLTFIGPPGKKYSVPDIIDIINEGLLTNESTQRYYLINRGRSFTLVRAGEEIPPELLPRITVDDLSKHGNTEVVQVVFPLHNLEAEDLEAEVTKMKGPFGKVTAMASANQLVLQDTVANLKRIIKTIERVESNTSDRADSYSHECKYIQARKAAQILKDLLGDPEEIIRQIMRSMPRSRDPRSQQSPNVQLPKLRMHYISYDERLNSVLVTGPADKIAQAKAIMEKIDVGATPVIPGGPILKSYSVPQGTSEALAETLQEAYQDSPNTRIASANDTTILVWATPEDQFKIGQEVLGIDKGTDTKAFAIGSLESATVAETLKAMYGEPDTGAPYIEAQPEQNRIIARGTPDQLQAVEASIIALGGPSQGGTGGEGTNMRIITLEQGSAAILAEALQKKLKELVDNPVEVEIRNPYGSTPSGPAPPAEKPPPMEKLPPVEKPPPMDRTTPLEGKIGRVSGTVPQEFPVVAMDEPPPPTPTPKDNRGKTPPVRIIASGNQLMVFTDDPKAMALIQSLVRLYTKNPEGKGDFEVIVLKYADATEAAQALDEVFNGSQQEREQNARTSRFSRGSSSTPPEPPRIRVVAYPPNNSILVQASPLDMLTVRHLLETTIDSGDKESDALIRPYTIELKYARASEVATQVSTVFAEFTRENTSLTSRTSRFGGFFGRSRGGTPQQNNLKPVLLTVTADDRSNLLIVTAPKLLYEDVKQLTDMLDEKARDNKRVVRLIPIKGIDPLVVQNALAAYQGQPITPTTPPTTAPYPGRGGGDRSDGGGFQPGFPGIGGFQPGGGGFQPPYGGGGPPSASPGAGFPGGRPGIGGGTPGGGRPAIGGGRSGGGSRFGGASRSSGGGRSGGGRSGGGGRSSRGSGGRPGGRNFFVDRVMEDPKNEPSLLHHGQPKRVKTNSADESPLYDPQRDRERSRGQQGRFSSPVGPNAARRGPASNRDHLQLVGHTSSGWVPSPRASTLPEPASRQSNAPLPLAQRHHGNNLVLTNAQPEQPRQPVPPEGPPQAPVAGPVGPVEAQALDQLGAIILSGRPEDVEAAEAIIRYLLSIEPLGDIQIRVVPLEHQDATSLATTLSDLYQRVVVGTGSNTRAAPPQQVRGQQGQVTTQALLSSVVLIPLPRFNAIILAAPKARLDEIETQIKELDRPNALISRTVAFPLKRANALQVATLLSNFYAQRYPPETQLQNQVRITFDEPTNTVFVQASPADLTEIRELIKHLDTVESSTIQNVEIVPLKNAPADELTLLLLQAINQGFLPTGVGGQGIVPQQGLQGAGFQGAGLQGLGGLQQLQGQPGVQGGLQGGVGGLGQMITGVKGTTLRFVSPRPDIPPVEASILRDVSIIPDLRTNSLIILAPPKTVQLILSVVASLDVPPAILAQVKVFKLKEADATLVAQIIQQLFFGLGQQPTGGAVQPGAPGALPGALPGGAALGQQGGIRPLQLTVGGIPSAGTALTEIRITVDQRTNSLIVAASESDLLVVEALISRLDVVPVDTRRNEVYHLQNSTAIDVAQALNSFFTASLDVLRNNLPTSAQLNISQEVVVVPEPITNKLLISTTERYYPEIIRLIQELDAELPQVVIQVLIAEVRLDGSEEFGVEFGLQSPVLFRRGTFPSDAFLGTGVASVTGGDPTMGAFLIPQGTSVSTTTSVAQPGFNFVNPALPLGNNPAVRPGTIGVQGLGSLGVGRISPNNGLGGFVFSAANDAFNLLIRALKTQGRIDVLTRPQIMTLDNQQAVISIGQNVPVPTTQVISTGGLAQSGIQYVLTGINLTVVPKITPDGRVIMRVTPSISALTGDNVALSGGGQAPIFDQQLLDTTVVAADGDTVAIGGLISRTRSKDENKIPWLGDLPGVGAMFRFRAQMERKQELLVILTPHIVRSKAEADRILAEEAHRIDWMIGDVIKTHGPYGMAPIFPPPPPDASFAPKGQAGMPPGLPGSAPTPGMMAQPAPSLRSPGEGNAAPGTGESLPPPRRLPPEQPQGPNGSSQGAAPQPSAAPLRGRSGAPSRTTTVPLGSRHLPGRSAPPSRTQSNGTRSVPREVPPGSQHLAPVRMQKPDNEPTDRGAPAWLKQNRKAPRIPWSKPNN